MSGAGVAVPPTVPGAGVAAHSTVYGAGVGARPTVAGADVAVVPPVSGADVAAPDTVPGASGVAVPPTVPGAGVAVPSTVSGAGVAVRPKGPGAGVADRSTVPGASGVAVPPTVPGARVAVPSTVPGTDVSVPPTVPGADVAVPPTPPVVAVSVPEASAPRPPHRSERLRSQTPDAPRAADRRPESDDDPHAYITAAVQTGRHGDADALAAEHEKAAVRAHGPGSEQALHWAEVRADLAMFAGDPVRSCRTWLGVAGARLTAGQTSDSAAVEAAVDRAHHQWSQIRDLESARELGSLLAELRGRVPGRRQGALENINRQLRQLQTQS